MARLKKDKIAERETFALEQFDLNPKMSVAKLNKALKVKFGPSAPIMRNKRVYELRAIAASKRAVANKPIAAVQAVAARNGISAAGMPETQPKPGTLREMVRSLVYQIIEEDLRQNG